jgi:DNA-binding transcriptional regulator GbsR (MarR family)
VRIKVSDIEESNYYKMPKSIYELDLNSIDREVYMLCLENWRLSVSNNWVNESGEIYFYATQEKISEVLKVNKSTIIRSFKKLIENNLLETEKENGNANKYFLKKIKVVEKNNQCQNATGGKLQPYQWQNATGGKMQPDQWQNATATSGKMQPNKEEIKKNNIIRKNIYISERFKQTFSDFLEMRKTIKKPATEKAIEMIIKKLEKVDNEELAIQMLERSIINSWQDVYEIRRYNGDTNNSGNNTKQEPKTKWN